MRSQLTVLEGSLSLRINCFLETPGLSFTIWFPVLTPAYRSTDFNVDGAAKIAGANRRARVVNTAVKRIAGKSVQEVGALEYSSVGIRRGIERAFIHLPPSSSPTLSARCNLCQW